MILSRNKFAVFAEGKKNSSSSELYLFVTPDYPALGQIIRRHFYENLVPRDYTDKIHP